MVISYDDATENDEYLDNLAFMCYDEYDSSTKLNYYKELFQRDSIEAVVSDDVSQPIGFSPPTISSDGPMDSPWPMSCHDIHHTGRSPYNTSHISGEEKWRFECGWVESPAIVDTNGTIYFGSFDGYLYAVYPNGTMKWKYEMDWIWSSPAIDENGTIYVGAWDDYLYAIYQNGSLKWRFCAYDDISCSPAIDDNGTIYFGTMLSGNYIFAVNPNGTEKWRYKTGFPVVSDPAIGNDGTIYIGSGDSYLYALYPNGTLKWRFNTGDYIKGPVSIANDGTVYFTSLDGYLYAAYPNNGTEKWRCRIDSGAETNPSIGIDDIIYVGGERLYAIYPNGTIKWEFDLGPNRWIGSSSAAISSEGIIYVGIHIGENSGGEIIAINPNGSERWRRFLSNDWCESSPIIAEDGTIYIGSTNSMDIGFLHAFSRDDLEADANGPYFGTPDGPIYFHGSATGGYFPYNWHWNFGDGIRLEYSIHNNISRNIISNSSVNILFHFYSSGNIIRKNIIRDGRDRGILIMYGSDKNTICGNTIANSGWVGIQLETSGNKVCHNNFIKNKIHACFVFFSFPTLISYNKWDGNYWDNWIGLEHPLLSKFPKIIVGALTRTNLLKIPCFTFDWHPARKPYDVGM